MSRSSKGHNKRQRNRKNKYHHNTKSSRLIADANAHITVDTSKVCKPELFPLYNQQVSVYAELNFIVLEGRHTRILLNNIVTNKSIFTEYAWITIPRSLVWHLNLAIGKGIYFTTTIIKYGGNTERLTKMGFSSSQFQLTTQ